MQIPGTSLAAGVAGVTAQSTADKNTTHVVGAAPDAAQVERSGESNPDRDAQGQGDGLGRRSRHQPPSPEGKSLAGDSSTTPPAPTLPDEPPSQLDLLG